MQANATERFTGRSLSYTKFRPSYPIELLHYLNTELEWDSSKRIADVGAGTGIFTSLLLEQGYSVTAIEPNADMRQQLQTLLEPEPRKASSTCDNGHVQLRPLTISEGQAECTGLAAASVDGIVCAQSFHWFDADLTRSEFLRVLVPNGMVVLLWNQRDVDASPFMSDYEALFLQYAEGYRQVKHKEMSVETLTNFFGGNPPHLKSFPYEHKLDRQGLLGRIASSSFSLTERDESYRQFMNDIDRLYREHEHNGTVVMNYRTDVYWGKLI